MLRIDSNIIWTIVNLLILYWLMMKFLFKPVREVIAKRKEEIDNSFSEVQKQSEQAEARENQANEKLEHIDEICSDRIAEAKVKANEEYNKIVDSANEESKQIIAKAREDTVEAVNDEKKKAQREVTDMIESAASKMAGTQNDSKLYDDFLNGME